MIKTHVIKVPETPGGYKCQGIKENTENCLICKCHTWCQETGCGGLPVKLYPWVYENCGIIFSSRVMNLGIRNGKIESFLNE